jgi:hypothetical protein
MMSGYIIFVHDVFIGSQDLQRRTRFYRQSYKESASLLSLNNLHFPELPAYGGADFILYQAIVLPCVFQHQNFGCHGFASSSLPRETFSPADVVVFLVQHLSRRTT